MDPLDSLRTHLQKLLDWNDAHVDFDRAVSGLQAEHVGTVPPGLPYSPWQLLEHMRIAQHDILDFCRNTDYEELDWPDDYGPRASAPASPDAWDASVQAFHRDREALKALAGDGSIDLFARIPHGQGQTYLREILLAADHTAYHVGEMVAVRRLLGLWS